MNEKDIINKYLNDIHTSKGGYQFNAHPNELMDKYHTVNIARKLVDLGLITKLERGDRLFALTALGESVVENGGWTVHLLKEAVKKKRAEDKEKYEYLMSKWKYRTFWPSIILGVIGGTYSIVKIIEYVVTVVQTKNPAPLQ